MHPKQATSKAMQTLIDNVRLFDKFSNALRSGTAFGRSVLVVAATGNESGRFSAPAFVLGPAYPSATEDFVSVSAVEATGDNNQPYKIAGFANSGGKFAAPGVDILSAIPGGSLGLMSGTSMATPHVAGVAALWAQKLLLTGVATAEKILDKLKVSAKVPAGLDEADVGYGIPQAP